MDVNARRVAAIWPLLGGIAFVGSSLKATNITKCNRLLVLLNTDWQHEWTGFISVLQKSTSSRTTMRFYNISQQLCCKIIKGAPLASSDSHAVITASLRLCQVPIFLCWEFNCCQSISPWGLSFLLSSPKQNSLAAACTALVTLLASFLCLGTDCMWVGMCLRKALRTQSPQISSVGANKNTIAIVGVWISQSEH